LIYICGPSGAGKDTLIQFARTKLSENNHFLFAHRYITRPANAGGENHIALSPKEFVIRLSAGLFAMHWESHGLHYGIGSEIDLWLAAGKSVIVNGSREYLPHAKARFPQLVDILIDLPDSLLEKRLMERGRESREQILERMERNRQLKNSLPPSFTLLNEGSIHDAGHQLVRHIKEMTVHE
jgi:ribose 1,5-bisphosphokinase